MAFPTISPHYTLERELGRGGMSLVYLAEDHRHGRKVAVKVLAPEVAASLGPERFLREIRIAASLIHPHIVPLIDSGESDGLLYYVSPFISGGSLRDRLTASHVPTACPSATTVGITYPPPVQTAWAYCGGTINSRFRSVELTHVVPHAGVRAISMSGTEGLKRGLEVTDCGAPISMPVGQIVGRMNEVRPVAEVMAEAGNGVPLRRIGVQDTYATAGTRPYLFREFGLSSQRLVEVIWELAGQSQPVPVLAEVSEERPGVHEPV